MRAGAFGYIRAVKRTRPVSAILFGGVWLVGCGEPTAAGPADPCELRAGEDCDVQDDECVEHVHAVVACMRAAEHPLPKVVRMTAEEYVAQLPEPEPPSAEQARADAQYQAGFKLLGLLPRDWAPAPADDSQGLPTPYITYSWETETLTIVADGADPEAELYALTYTLVLADRDQEVGIAGLLSESGTFDGDRAISALAAGEATFYTDLARVRDSDFAGVVARFSYADAIAYVHDVISDPDATWGAAIGAFQYYHGAAGALARYLEDGADGVSAGYAEQTRSTAYALAASDEIEAMFSGVDTELPAPPDGYRWLYQDSMGPLMWHLSSVRLGGVYSAQDAAALVARGWVGDRVAFAGSIEGDDAAVVWQLATSDGQVAETRVYALDAEVGALFEEAFAG